MESIEVQYAVIQPFLSQFKGDMKKTQDEIAGEIAWSKTIRVDGELVFNYVNKSYKTSGNNPLRVEKIYGKTLIGKKISCRKGKIYFPRDQRIVAAFFNTPTPYYDTCYFGDNTDNSVYTLKYKNKRWILEREEFRNPDILKVDLKNDDDCQIHHLGAEIKEKTGKEEFTMGKCGSTIFYTHLINNNFGKIPEKYDDILMDMIKALIIIDKKISPPC